MNNLIRVFQYAARCCREDERGRIRLHDVEKEFPEIAEWVSDYFKCDEGKEFFNFDGRTIELKEYYQNIPVCVMLSGILTKCRKDKD